MAIANKFAPNNVSLRTVDGGVLSYDLASRETHTIDLDPKIHALDEAVPGAPILGLQSKIGGPKTVKQPIYFMLRKRQLPRFFNVDTGGYTATASTIPVAAADVGKVKDGYHIMNTITREVLAINGTPATSMPVEREVGSVAAAAGTAGDEILILGYRGAERDDKFLDFIRQPDVIFNYVGELQKVYGVSQYESASDHLAGHDPLSVLRMDKLQEQRLELEWGILFDQRSKRLRASDSKVVFTTGGIDSFLTENETDFSGSLTEAKLITAARGLRRHAAGLSMDRWVCASPLFMEKLTGIWTDASSNIRRNGDGGKDIGIDVETYKWAGLRFHFFQHPLLDDATSTNANSLKGHAFVLDLDDMSLTTMSGPQVGFFKWFMNVQTPGAREKQDQLVTNFGVKMTRPEHYARWFNVGT